MNIFLLSLLNIGMFLPANIPSKVFLYGTLSHPNVPIEIGWSEEPTLVNKTVFGQVKQQYIFNPAYFVGFRLAPNENFGISMGYKFGLQNKVYVGVNWKIGLDKK